MGKTLWKDTLAHYYDMANKDQFSELFGHLEIGKTGPTTLANRFYVLPLTFAGITANTVDKFKWSLNNKLNRKFIHFKNHYNLLFELYMLIDKYDMCINKALGNHDLMSALQVDTKGSLLKRMESMYADFFSRVKLACDVNVAWCFVMGVTPLALTEFMSGFNIARNITHSWTFTSLYGFMEANVWNRLVRLPQAQPAVADLIVESWQRNHNGYYFHPQQEVALGIRRAFLRGFSGEAGA